MSNSCDLIRLFLYFVYDLFCIIFRLVMAYSSNNAWYITYLSIFFLELPRPRRRLMELLYNTACKPAEKDQERWAQAQRDWHLMFHRSPLEFLPSADGSSVAGVRLGINTLKVHTCHWVMGFSVSTLLTSVISCFMKSQENHINYFILLEWSLQIMFILPLRREHLTCKP